MKTLKLLITLPLATALLSGCGAYKKNPVTDIDQLRENGKNEMDKGPDKPQVLTDTVIVKEPVPVIKEQATVDDKYILVTAETSMSFVEGQSSSYQVLARPQIPGLKVQLTAQGLPADAKFEKTSSDQQGDHYTFTWTPALHMVPANLAFQNYKMKIIAQVTQVPDGKDKSTLQGLTRESQITLSVTRQQAAVSDVTVSGLPAEVTEGTLTPFTIVATVPGVDDKSASAPSLTATPDDTYVAGAEYRELDASRHVIIDQIHRAPEYQGQFKWKFYRIFDTKNISVQPPRGKDDLPMPNAEAAHVRMNLKVFSPFGATSPNVLERISIKMVLPFTAPRFDMSGLGAQSLELTPGQTMKLIFTVQSNHPRSVVKVELPDISTFVGKPSLNCVVNAKSAARQDCALLWKVPCDAKDSDLTQDISLSAIASLDGKNTDLVTQVLKTTRSQKSKVACPASGGTK